MGLANSFALKILMSHPTGNANVREALTALCEQDLLDEFWTTICWNCESKANRLLPLNVFSELKRRSFPQVPLHLTHTRPWRETVRLIARRAGIGGITRSNTSPFSSTQVCYSLDRSVAKRVARHHVTAVYAYEDSALKTFENAQRLGIRTIYELPIAYWKAMHCLLKEEAELCPGWVDTMPSAWDLKEKTDRKDEELERADIVIVPSRYVLDSLPESLRTSGRVKICPYGAPAPVNRIRKRHSKLRVLYVGGMTQRKGVAYLLRALRKVETLVEVTLIGNRVGKCVELDEALVRYRYLETIPHARVLEEMENHDVLVFPSLTEGLSLSVLEALSRGLPVITTPNSGATEAISDGCEGFIVPIRSVDPIAEKLERLASDRELLETMSRAALRRAAECGWQAYRKSLVSTIREMIH